MDARKSSGDRALSGARTVPALAAGAQSTDSVTVRVPSATPRGTYFLVACADHARTTAESNEGNNCRVAAVSVRVR